MTFDVITIFPDFFRSMLEYGLLKRAIACGQAGIRLHDLRDFTEDRHRTVDDRPFGGGPGMVFKPGPVFKAVAALEAEMPGQRLPVILLSPQGRLFTQAVAEELSRQERLVLICGRYEGVDERIAEHLATDEISIGDYVLSGGELPAALIMESVVRLLPGVLGNEESASQDSFATRQAGASESRPARLSPLYKAAGVPGLESPGSPAFGESRRDSPLAPPAGARENMAKAARLAGRLSFERRRSPMAGYPPARGVRTSPSEKRVAPRPIGAGFAGDSSTDRGPTKRPSAAGF
jgi:tRNA (guanine37-N1)-methyltransferase